MTYGEAEPGDVFLGNRPGASSFVVVAILKRGQHGRMVLIWDFESPSPHSVYFSNDMVVWLHDVERTSAGRPGVTSGA